jgi:hypothetical protein
MHDDGDNPYAPPTSGSLTRDLHQDYPDPAWRHGNTLVARKGAELPDRCIKCNAPAGGYRFSRKLSWHSQGWYLLIFVSLLIYILVYFLVRWQGRVTVGLCERHRTRRKRAILWGWLASLAGIGLLIAGVGYSDRSRLDSSPLGTIGMVGGLVLLLAGLIGGMIGAQVLVPVRIDKHYIWLKKVSPDYLAELPEWNA